MKFYYTQKISWKESNQLIRSGASHEDWVTMSRDERATMRPRGDVIPWWLKRRNPTIDNDR
jgi:hypothetical protein